MSIQQLVQQAKLFMKSAIIGLGKIGRRVAIRLYTKSFDVHCYDRNEEAMHTLGTVQEYATEVSNSLNCFKTPYQAVWKMPKPRVVLLFVPAGNAVDEVIYCTELGLSPNDVIVDCGNSHYRHSIARAERLSKKGIGFLDAGFSGGLEGALQGASITIGGEKEYFETAQPILEAIAFKNGLHYLGKSGNGHYAKMVHNAIEYSLMQSYAEGLELLSAKGIDLKKAVEAWRNGSVIRSWLLDLVSNALNGNLDDIEGQIGGGETGRWAVEEALKRKVPFGMAMQALNARNVSNDKENIAPKIVAALRKEFGGHEVKKK